MVVVVTCREGFLVGGVTRWAARAHSQSFRGEDRLQDCDTQYNNKRITPSLLELLRNLLPV